MSSCAPDPIRTALIGGKTSSASPIHQHARDEVLIVVHLSTPRPLRSDAVCQPSDGPSITAACLPPIRTSPAKAASLPAIGSTP